MDFQVRQSRLRGRVGLAWLGCCGATACATDPVCPAVDWAANGTPGPLAFVDVAAEPGGDGSEQRPFRTIAEGLDAVDEGGGTVAILPGTYREGLDLGLVHDGVVLQGACQAGVVLDGAGLDYALVSLSGTAGTAASLRDLTLRGGAGGVQVQQGALDLQHVKVVDSRSYGVRVEARGRLTAQGLLVERSELLGLSVLDGGQADVVGSAISGTRSDEHGAAVGLEVLGTGSQATLEHCAIRDNAGSGVQLEQGGAADLIEVAILGPRESPDIGVQVRDGGVLGALGGRIEGAGYVGLYVAEDSAAWLDGVEILNTRPGRGTDYGIGMVAVTDATIVATRTRVDRSHVLAVAVWGDGPGDATPATISLTDCEVGHTSKGDDDSGGFGLYADQGGRLTLEQVVIRSNFTHGVLATNAARLAMDDVDIQDTFRNDRQLSAVGVFALNGATVDARGLRVQRTSGPGLGVVLDAELSCTDCSLLGNSFAGAVTQAGGRLILRDSYLGETAVDAVIGGGTEVFASGSLDGTSLLIEGCTLEASAKAAVYVTEQSGEGLPDGGYRVVDSDLVWAAGSPDGSYRPDGTGVFVHGSVAAWNADAQRGLWLVGDEFSGFPDAAVFFDGAGGQIEGSLWSGNGIDVWQQLCSHLPPEVIVPDDSAQVLCPHEGTDFLTTSMLFQYNENSFGILSNAAGRESPSASESEQFSVEESPECAE